MKRMLLVFFIAVFSTFSHAETKPSAELIKELLGVMNTKNTTELMLEPFKKIYKDEFDKMYTKLRTTYTTNEQDKIIKKKFAAILTYIDKVISWETIEPKIIPIYQQELSEKVIKESIAFYKSEAGRTILEKLPSIMKKSNEAFEPAKKEMEVYMNENLQNLIKELDASVAGK